MALTADEFLDAPEAPAAMPSADAFLEGDDTLATLRAGYLNELEDPETRGRVYSLTHREVGGQGPEAQQAFIETLFNRAAARNQTLAQTVSDRNYYPGVSLRPARLSEGAASHYAELAENAAQGSNISNLATGNASGTVGFAGGPQTFRAGGERFGIEGPDRRWARNLGEVRQGIPVEQVDEVVRIEKAIPVKVRELEVARALPVEQSGRIREGEAREPGEVPSVPTLERQPAPKLPSADEFLDAPEPLADVGFGPGVANPYPEDSPEYRAIERARPLLARQVPAATARGPTVEEAVQAGIPQVTPQGVEIPRRIQGEPGTVPEAYQQAGGGIPGVIASLDFAAKSPILDKDQARQLVAMSGAAAIAKSMGVEEAGKITEERAANMLSESSTPAALAQMALLKYPVARALFAGQLVDATGEDIATMKQAYDKGDKSALTQAITDSVAHAGMVAALAAGEGQLARRSGYFRTEVTGVGPPVYEPRAAGPALPAGEAAAVPEAPFEALPPGAPRGLPAAERPALPAEVTQPLTRPEAITVEPSAVGPAPPAAEPAQLPATAPAPRALPEPVRLVLDTSIPANERYGMQDQLEKLGFDQDQISAMTTAQARRTLTTTPEAEAPAAPAAAPEAELEPAMSADEFLDAPAEVAPFRPRQARAPTQTELAQREHQAELLRQGRADIEAQGGMDILEALKREGFMPGIGHRFAEPYRGELKALRETIRGTKGVRYRDVFSGNPKVDMDQLLLRLRARGFDIETPHQLIDAVQRRVFSGQPHYGLPEMGETLYGETRVAQAPARYGAPSPIKAVATRDLTTGKIYRGRPGESHSMLDDRLIARGVDLKNVEPGFVTQAGEYLNRQAAHARAIQARQIKAKSGEYSGYVKGLTYHDLEEAGRVAEPSAAYRAVSAKTSAATTEFNKAQAAYRAGTISDKEFLAARAKHQAAQAEFDKAFAAEQARPRPRKPAPARPATGAELFAPEEMPFTLRGEELTEEIGPEGAARARADAEATARREQMRLLETPNEQEVGAYLDKQGVRPESQPDATQALTQTLALTQEPALQELYQPELFGAPGAAGPVNIPGRRPGHILRGPEAAKAGFYNVQLGRGRLAGEALAANKNRISIILPELVKGTTPGFDLRGKTILAPVDFAQAVQTIRSPYQESLKVVLTEPKTGRVLASEITHLGTLNESIAHPRDIMRQFVLFKEKYPGAELWISHNHPSGDPSPSSTDIALHDVLELSAQMAGTRIRDHVITNGKQYYSLNEKTVGDLPTPVKQPWEVIPQVEMPKIQSPADWQVMAAGLRNDAPNAAHIFYVGTRHNLVGVERVTYGNNLNAIRKQMASGISREGAYAVLVDLPEGAGRDDLQMIEKITLALRAKLLDVSWPGMVSAEARGMIPRPPSTAYSTGEGAPPSGAPPTARAAEEPEETAKYRRFAERFQQDQRVAQDIRDAVGNREYDPIPNNVTAAQARELVNRRPIADVINAIKDETNGLPFHIRSTMGQLVIQRLNEAYKNLERNGVAKDADTVMNQAIDMAEWQQDYGTRLGQGVQSFAMWERLTPEGKLRAVQRRVRQARRRYSGEHPGEVEQVTDVLNGSGSPADKVAALKKLFKTNVTARKAKPYIQKLIEAAKSGHFTDQDFYDIAAERLGLPKYDKATAAEIMKMAHKIDDAPEGIPKDQATLDLNKYIATQMGFRPSDLPIGIYYGNMLSGYNTQIVNAVDTFVNVLSELSGLAMANPRAGMKIFANATKGFKEGTADALLALTRGRMLTDQKWMDQPRLMEVAKFGQKGGVPILTATRTGRVMKRIAESRIAKPLNAWKYVSRLMAASDTVMFRGAKEGRAALLADRAAREEGLKGNALDKRVQEMLGRAPDQLRDISRQAEEEGFTGAAKVARATELRMRLRDTGANADATDFAGMASYNHEPHGMLGYFANAMGRASQKFPILKLAVPFTRIVANVTNRGLNYTPWGFKRAFRGYSGEPPPKGDERAAHVTRAAMGTVGMGLLWALQQSGAIQINGAGPSDPEKRRQLQESGWRPYSLKIGDKYWSYIYTPIGLGLSVLGNMSDAIRYGELSKKDAFTRGAYAISRIGSTIFSQSFLSGLTNIFDALSGGGSPGETIASIRRQVSTTAGTATTPRIFLDIQRLFDPTRYDSNTIGQDLLKNTPFAALTNKPTLNAFGEPVTMPTNRFVSPATKDLAWQLVTGRNLRVPVPDKYTTMPDGKGGSRQITPDEYYDYLQKTGPALKQWILRNQFMMQYGDPTKMQENLNAKGQEIREPVLRRLRIHARYNPVK